MGLRLNNYQVLLLFKFYFYHSLPSSALHSSPRVRGLKPAVSPVPARGPPAYSRACPPGPDPVLTRLSCPWSARRAPGGWLHSGGALGFALRVPHGVMASWIWGQGRHESAQPGNTNKLVLTVSHASSTEPHGRPLRPGLSSCPFHRCRNRVSKVRQLASHQDVARSVGPQSRR